MPGYVTKTGFNDEFHRLANDLGAYPLQEANSLHGPVLRFGLYWSNVQPNPPGNPLNWGSYSTLRSLALNTPGVRLLPVVIDTPGWAGPGGSGSPNGYGPSQSHLGDFGDFALATIAYFGVNLLAGFEVWNEPNKTTVTSYVPPEHTGAMLASVLTKVNSAYGPTFPVLGGSLAMGDSTWTYYMPYVDNQCFPFALSIHAYAGRQQLDVGVSPTITEIQNRITNAVLDVRARNTGKVTGVWVTETGAPSGACNGTSRLWSQSDQTSVIFSVNNWLSQVPEARAMLLHRLYDIDGGNLGYETYSVCQGSYSPPPWAEKSVCSTLRAIW